MCEMKGYGVMAKSDEKLLFLVSFLIKPKFLRYRFRLN